MKIHKRIKLKVVPIVCLCTLVAMVWAEEEKESNKDSFETCLEELKAAASSSTEEETGNEYDAELLLDESIRIYDECLSREGVTLTIHGTLGEGGGTGNGTGSTDSEMSTNGTESEAQTTEDGTTPADESTATQSNDLESSLHEFDEMLSQAQEEIDADRTNNIAQTTQDSTTEQQDGSESLVSEESEDSHVNPTAMVSAEAKHENTTTRNPLDPKDEDIVLKTIREAAELETDPTTKQALWDQYYDYADKK